MFWNKECIYISVLSNQVTINRIRYTQFIIMNKDSGIGLVEENMLSWFKDLIVQININQKHVRAISVLTMQLKDT